MTTSESNYTRGLKTRVVSMWNSGYVHAGIQARTGLTNTKIEEILCECIPGFAEKRKEQRERAAYNAPNLWLLKKK